MQFCNIVDAKREPYVKYSEKESDNQERRVEKRKLFTKDLMYHFKSFGRIVNGNWKWGDAYHIILENGEKVSVCKQAWCGIVGVTVGIVEHV